MTLWLLLGFLFSTNNSLAGSTDNPNITLMQSLSANPEYQGLKVNQNISAFINSQDCKCGPKKGFNIKLPSSLTTEFERLTKKERAKFEVKLTSANLKYYDEYGNEVFGSLSITNDGLSFTGNQRSFLIEAGDDNEEISCEKISTPKEKQITKNCRQRVRSVQNKNKAQYKKVVKECSEKIEKVRKEQRSERARLTKECLRNSREVGSFAELQQGVINKSRPSGRTNDDESDIDQAINKAGGDQSKTNPLGIRLSLKLNDQNAVRFKDNTFVVSRKAKINGKKISYSTNLEVTPNNKKLYFSVRNKLAKNFDGKKSSTTTLTAATGNNNSLVTASVTATNKSNDRTKYSATVTGAYEQSKELVLYGFLTVNDESDYNFGVSGENANGTKYSARRVIGGLNSDNETDAIYASVQKPIKHKQAGVDNLAFTASAISSKNSDEERKGVILFGFSGTFK